MTKADLPVRCAFLITVLAVTLAGMAATDTPKPQPAPSSNGPGVESSPDDTDWLQDPFKHLSIQITDVSTDLARPQTDQPVQTKEHKIVAHMDTLIELLEKECKKSGNGAPRNPPKPRADSVLANGPGGQGDLRDPAHTGRDWANLPPREREKVLQAQTAGFPPGHEAP